MDLTAIIITRNEEKNIERCLRSLPDGAHIVVVDSLSDDATVEIASKFGAQVERRAFTDYADQKNFACSFAKSEWILWLDADEVLHPDLRDAISEIVRSNPNGVSAYLLPRRLFFAGRTLNFGKSTDWPLRLFRRREGHFVGRVHEKVIIKNGLTRRLSRGFITHYSYRDLTDYFARFNKYTSLISKESAGKRSTLGFHLNLYLRFWFEFITRYFVRLGFLDGYPGYCYALISSMYTFVKYAKQREQRDG